MPLENIEKHMVLATGGRCPAQKVRETCVFFDVFHDLTYLIPSSASQPSPAFWSDPSKWFLAITCAIWLRLQFQILDSAWFFSAHLLFFHAQGRIFEPRIGFLDLGSTFWPGDLFGVKNGSRKKWICDGIILSWRFRRNSQTQMDSMDHRIRLGLGIFPELPWQNDSVAK